MHCAIRSEAHSGLILEDGARALADSIRQAAARVGDRLKKAGELQIGGLVCDMQVIWVLLVAKNAKSRVNVLHLRENALHRGKGCSEKPERRPFGARR